MIDISPFHWLDLVPMTLLGLFQTQRAGFSFLKASAPVCFMLRAQNSASSTTPLQRLLMMLPVRQDGTWKLRLGASSATVITLSGGYKVKIEIVDKDIVDALRGAAPDNMERRFPFPSTTTTTVARAESDGGSSSSQQRWVVPVVVVGVVLVVAVAVAVIVVAVRLKWFSAVQSKGTGYNSMSA